MGIKIIFIVLFEGEYLNGIKWNGKGKEYDSDNKLIFEGNYYKGKKWIGKGVEFFGELCKFEGEYLYSYWKTGKLFIKIIAFQ